MVVFFQGGRRLYWNVYFTTIVFFTFSPLASFSMFARRLLQLPLALLLFVVPNRRPSAYRNLLHFTTFYHSFYQFTVHTVRLFRSFCSHGPVSLKYWFLLTDVYSVTVPLLRYCYIARHSVRCSWEPPFRRLFSKFSPRITLHHANHPYLDSSSRLLLSWYTEDPELVKLHFSYFSFSSFGQLLLNSVTSR